MKALLKRMIAKQYNMDELQKLIRLCIGLNRQQAAAKYGERQRRYRAQMIAYSEMASACNLAQEEHMLFSDYIQVLAAEQGGRDRAGRFRIHKLNEDKMLAFGWANVSINIEGEQIIDWQQDIIEPEELEQAAYRFVELYREGGEMHERGDARAGWDSRPGGKHCFYQRKTAGAWPC